MSSSVCVLSHSVPTVLMSDDGELGTLIPAEFTYQPDKPYAVTMKLADDLEWEFGRELLLEGLQVKSGAGDVHVQPDEGALLIELSSPDGTATLDCDRVSVEGFLQATYTSVPNGDEADLLEVDLCIEQLLADT
jgi:hypothetical protein